MMEKKILNITAWVVAALLTVLYVFSAYGKLTNPAQLEAVKLGNWSTIIAIGEIISALLFLIPKTNKYGTLLLSSYMGGAIIIHMTGGTSILIPVVILILVWSVAFLRDPKMFKL